MKKFIAIVLGASAMIACTKTSVSYEPTGEVAFKPVAQINKTKAAVNTSEFPSEWVMGVYSYHQTLAAGSDVTEFDAPTLYIDNKQFKKFQGTWAGWSGSAHAPYYWPKTGSLVFTAYAPFTGENPKVSHEFSVKDGAIVKDILTANDYVQSNEPTKTVDFMWCPITSESYDSESGKAGVPMVFKHAMSWITFKAKADAADVFSITGIELKKVSTKGSFTTAHDSIDWVESTADADLKDIAVYSNTTGGVALTTGASAEIENTERGTVVIPQALSDAVVAVINFTEKSAGAATTIKHQVSLVLNTCTYVPEGGKETKLAEWQAGKHYIYELQFGHSSSDEILIAPKVEDWKNVNVTSGQIN